MSEVILKVDHLKKYFPVKAKMFSGSKGTVHAVDDVSFEIRKGETFGLVGESGCGKSTLSRTILNLVPADGGTIIFNGEDITNLKGKKMEKIRRQSQVLNLLKDLQKEFELTYLFISHNLSVVKFMADRIAVMYLGVIVELADSGEIYENASHPYTKALLSAIPEAKTTQKKERIILNGDIPSPVDPPAGCRFCTRCPFAQDRCRTERPELAEIRPGHFAACFLAGKGGS